MSHNRRNFLKAALATSLAGKVQQPSTSFFPGFETRRITTSGATIHTRHGGSGPPLLLLHGYPQTHVEWHKIAAELARHFTLVIPDLRGYGASKGPPGD